MKEKMRKWTEKHWGKRCKEFAWGCPCCMAWASYDYLFDVELKAKPSRMDRMCAMEAGGAE